MRVGGLLRSFDAETLIIDNFFEYLPGGDLSAWVRGRASAQRRANLAVSA
jgi:hypothetical protein